MDHEINLIIALGVEAKISSRTDLSTLSAGEKNCLISVMEGMFYEALFGAGIFDIQAEYFSAVRSTKNLCRLDEIRAECIERFGVSSRFFIRLDHQISLQKLRISKEHSL